MDEKTDSFSWRKFFNGVFNPLTTGKVIALGLNSVVVFALLFFGLKAFVFLKNKILPERKNLHVIETVNGGQVEIKGDNRSKLGLINF